MPRKKKPVTNDGEEAQPQATTEELFSSVLTELGELERVIRESGILQRLEMREDEANKIVQGPIFTAINALKSRFKEAVRKAIRGRSSVKTTSVDALYTHVKEVKGYVEKALSKINTARGDVELAQVGMKEIVNAAAEVNRQQEEIKATRKQEREMQTAQRAQERLRRIQAQLAEAQRTAATG